MPTDIFQAVPYARRVEFDYHNDASTEEWFDRQRTAVAASWAPSMPR